MRVFIAVFLFSLFCFSVPLTAQEEPAYKEYTYSERADQAPIDWFRFTADGSKLLVSEPKSFSVWDAETGKELHRILWSQPPHDEQSALGRLLILSPDGTKLAAQWKKEGGKISIHDTITGKEIQKIAVGQIAAEESAICFSPDSSRLLLQTVAEGKGNLYCYETATGKELWHGSGSLLERPDTAIHNRWGLDRFAIQPSFPFSNDGSKILTLGAERNVCVVLEAATGKMLCRAEGYDKNNPSHQTADFVLSPDGKSIFACCMATSRMLVWDAGTGTFQREISTKTDGHLIRYEYSPNCKKIIVSGGILPVLRVGNANTHINTNAGASRISCINLESGSVEYMRPYFAPQPVIQKMWFFDDGKRAVLESAPHTQTLHKMGGAEQSILKNALIWNVEEGYGLRSISFPDCSPNWKQGTKSCELSPDGKKLVYFYSGETPAEAPKPSISWIKWRIYDMETALKDVPPTGSPDLLQIMAETGFPKEQLVGFALYTSTTLRDKLSETLTGNKHMEMNSLRMQIHAEKTRLRNLGFHTSLPYQVVEAENNRAVLCVPMPFRCSMGAAADTGTARFKPGLAGLDGDLKVYATEIGQYNLVTNCYDGDAYLRGNNGAMTPCPKEDVLRHADDPNLYFAEEWHSDLYIDITGKPEVIKQLTEEPEKFAVKVELMNLFWQQQGYNNYGGYLHLKTLREAKTTEAARFVQQRNPTTRPTYRGMASGMSFDTVSASVIGVSIVTK